MTWASDFALSSLWFGAGAAAAWRFTMLHYKSRLNEARRSANLFSAWWERDSGKMLVAQAELDLIHQQHVDAGKAAHAAEKAKCAETTRALALSIGRPELAERISSPLDDTGRGVAPVSTSARAGFGSPAPLSHSCRGSAARRADGSGHSYPDMPTGRGPASPSGVNRAVNPSLLNF